jgi:hypothetical protein
VALCVPPLFVFAWMIMAGLKTGVQNISYPPEFIFLPTLENNGTAIEWLTPRVLAVPWWKVI